MSESLAEEAIERRKRQEAAVKRRRAIRKQVEKAACECFSTDGGKTLLRYLLKECGFLSSSVVINGATGEINRESMSYNEGRREVYLRLRSLLRSRPDILNEVELNTTEEVDGN